MELKNKICKIILKRKLFVVCVLASVTIILKTNMGPDFNFLLWRSDPMINISCHYIDNNNVIPELGTGYVPQPRSIFFHETSCQGNLTSRQACAVESAARAHPDWDVHVLFSSPLRKFALDQGSLKELHEIKNVKMMRVNIKDYALGTPLEQVVLQGALNKSYWTVEHTSDVLRYLTLYKWGGVYMDLDFVVVRSVTSLGRNWAARENDRCVSAGILSFSRDAVGKNIADMAIRDLSSKFRGDLYRYNGPLLITRVLQNICSTDDPKFMSSATCNGFEIYGHQFFYPLHWKHSDKYFSSGDLNFQNVYMAHIYNHRTQKCKVQKDSPYAKLARRYCPAIFRFFGDYFGE